MPPEIDFGKETVFYGPEGPAEVVMDIVVTKTWKRVGQLHRPWGQSGWTATDSDGRVLGRKLGNRKSLELFREMWKTRKARAKVAGKRGRN